jgi:hypothetical protein
LTFCEAWFLKSSLILSNRINRSKIFNQFLVNALKSTFTKVFIIETERLATVLATVGTAVLATVLTALATNNTSYSLIGMSRN